MNKPTRTEAIKRFLLASTHKDLAEMYNHDMEVQVNVAQDGGDRVAKEFKGVKGCARRTLIHMSTTERWPSLRKNYHVKVSSEALKVSAVTIGKTRAEQALRNIKRLEKVIK